MWEHQKIEPATWRWASYEALSQLRGIEPATWHWASYVALSQQGSFELWASKEAVSQQGSFELHHIYIYIPMQSQAYNILNLGRNIFFEGDTYTFELERECEIYHSNQYHQHWSSNLIANWLKSAETGLWLWKNCVRLIRFSERVLQPSLPIQSNSHSSPITACPWGPSRGDLWWCHDDCMLVSTICYYLRLFATFLCLTFAGFGRVMMCHVHFHVLPVKNKNGVLCINSSTMVGHSPVDTEYLGGSFRNPVGAHGGERKTACEGAFIFISLTVGSVSWWYVEVVPVS